MSSPVDSLKSAASSSEASTIRELPPEQYVVKKRQVKKTLSEAAQQRKERKSDKVTTKVAGFWCRWCGTNETPEVRKGPGGGKELCNACGQKYANGCRKDALIQSTNESIMERMALKFILNPVTPEAPKHSICEMVRSVR